MKINSISSAIPIAVRNNQKQNNLNKVCLNNEPNFKTQSFGINFYKPISSVVENSSSSPLTYDTILKRCVFKHPKNFSEIIGLEDAKTQLSSWIIQPLKMIEMREKEIKPEPIIAIYGAPESGKTNLVKALSCETEIPLYIIDERLMSNNVLDLDQDKTLEDIRYQLTQKFKKTGEYSLLLIDQHYPAEGIIQIVEKDDFYELDDKLRLLAKHIKLS